MTQITFTMPAARHPNGKPAWLNINDTRHWAPQAKLVKLWRNIGYYTAKVNHLPTGLHRVTIFAEIHKTDNRKYDAHNLMPTLKPIVDGLVDYGLIPDDNNTHLTGPFITEGEKRPRPEVTLTITPQ